MRPFDYQRPSTVDAACTALDASHLAYAGGTDLLPRVKSGLASPRQLVDLKHTDLSDEIVDHGDRITLGALVTLAAIERDALLIDRFSALPEAARQAATPQIRNRATIAGNLVQRPRCWYYRTPEISCWLKGGTGCPARDGRNEHHAIFPDDHCVAVHPSDLAGCLLALDATLHLHGADGPRTMPLADFYAAPSDERRTETVLGPSEVITAIDLDTTPPVVSTYRKAMDRAAWAFALVGVAVAATLEAGQLRTVRVVLSGVANTPRRARESEELLLDGGLDQATIAQAAAAAVAGSEPLSDNRYKQQLVVAMTRDALEHVSRQAT